METNTASELEKFMAENKGKRKFTQSVELAVNFKGIDFNKPENRLNMSISLPKGRGKESAVAVFADDQRIIDAAKETGAKLIPSSELEQIRSDKARMPELLDYDMFAQPSLMPQIAKALGQFLGPRNKMPRPIVGSDVKGILGKAGGSVSIRSKGKYLPTVHCTVGTESMPANDIAANVDQVVSDISKKVGKQNIKSVYLKLTMSKPIKIM
jgi:large subunit ribosomal protein L1